MTNSSKVGKHGYYRFVLKYDSTANYNVYLFDPPNGNSFKQQQVLNKNNHILIYELPIAVFNKINDHIQNMTFNFVTEDSKNNFITFNTTQINMDSLMEYEEPKEETKLDKVYVDFKGDKYWSEDMLWAIDSGLITGYEVTNLNSNQTEYLLKPYDTLSEAQALTVLYRFFKPDQMINATPDTNWWASLPYQFAKNDGLNTFGSIENITQKQVRELRGVNSQSS